MFHSTYKDGDLMKKILFAATVESHILNFHIPFINYFKSMGYEVHVICKLGTRRKELDDIGVKCFDVNFSRNPYSFSNIIALIQIIRIMKENSYELVHVHTPLAAFFTRFAANITNTKPVIYTAHGFHFYKGAPIKNWIIYYSMEKIAAHWTDGIITMNKEDFHLAHKLHIRQKKNIFLVNGVGVDVNKYAANFKEKNSIRKKMGLKDNDIILLTIAELIPGKNHKQVIDTIEKYYKESNIYYLIIGNGKHENLLKKYVTKKGLDKKITFLGFRHDVPEIINTCDIVILTSYREGLPRCLMEAMAASKPIIATDVRGNRDLVYDGVNGYLVPVDGIEETYKAIDKLICNKNLRLKKGQAGHEIILEYDIEKVLDQMKKIYINFL